MPHKKQIYISLVDILHKYNPSLMQNLINFTNFLVFSKEINFP